MLEVKNRQANLSGTRGDILEETALLFNALLDVAPEVLIICLKSYENDILSAVKKSNPIILKKGEELVAEIRKHIENDEEQTNE